MKLNPRLMKTVYTDLLHEAVTRPRIVAALETVDQYIASRAAVLFAPVLRYLQQAGEARACSEIEHHFSRNFGVADVTTVCEYLADQNLIGKVLLPIRLTKRSTVAVQELAFVYLQQAPVPLDEDNWEPGGPPTRGDRRR